MLNRWRKRYWRSNATALSEFENQRPATLVTGATRGIGFELARLLTEQNRHVVMVARSEADLRNAKDQLLKSLAKQTTSRRPEVITIAIDLMDTNAGRSIRDQLSHQGYYVDELINNAGIGLSGHFTTASPESLNDLNALNVTALTGLTREFLPDMLTRGRGGIINMASLGGLTPGPYQAAYYASKAYVISLTQALQYENRGQGVRFTVVAPGPVETQFHAQMDAERAFYRRFLPAMPPQSVARSTLFWYKLGRTVVVPGILNTILAVCLWALPGFLTIPVVAFLLNPRDVESDTGNKID